jgi:glycine oxidase
MACIINKAARTLLATKDEPVVKHLNYVVLGAGLMGRLLAHALATAGHSVSVYEASGEDGMGAAARVAASMLAPLAESAITEWPVVDMGQYSLQRWPELIQQLPTPVYFQQQGTLILWHKQDALQARMLVDKLQINSRLLPTECSPQKIDTDILQTLEPELSAKFQQGLFLPREGQLDNRQLLAGLLQSLQQQKVDIHWQSAKSLDDLVALHAGGADWVFDCRGTGASSDWTHLRGVRGEVIRLFAPEVNLQRPVRLMHPRYPLYVAPRPNGEFVVGATELESEDTGPVTVRSVLELASALHSLHPAFGEARILRLSAALRPALDDHRPSIERRDGVWHINGLYRHGYLCAPALVDDLVGKLLHDD